MPYCESSGGERRGGNEVISNALLWQSSGGEGEVGNEVIKFTLPWEISGGEGERWEWGNKYCLTVTEYWWGGGGEWDNK